MGLPHNQHPIFSFKNFFANSARWAASCINIARPSCLPAITNTAKKKVTALGKIVKTDKEANIINQAWTSKLMPLISDFSWRFQISWTSRRSLQKIYKMV